MSAGTTLWVAWQRPEALPGGDARILSFLPPSVEAELEKDRAGALSRAREASLPIRARARKLYVGLVARIGTARDAEGRTLRSKVAPSGQASRWWYHLTAFKDCEADPAFQWIIAILTIQAVARGLNAARLILVAPPPEVAEVLKKAYAVEERSPCPRTPVWRLWVRGALSRIKYGVKALMERRALRRLGRDEPDQRVDALFSGFWSWSVAWDETAGSLTDRYFKALPAALQRSGLSIGWLAWFDPWTAGARPGRGLAAALPPAGCAGLVVLQRYLQARDVVGALVSVDTIRTFRKIREMPAFRGAFCEEDLDFYPVFRDRLLSGFLDASIPHCELVATATERACRRLRPRVTVSFLEHFPYARAHYEGVRRAGTGTVNYVMQHASYNHEKTFLCLDPDLELRGAPDGCKVPQPDYVCAMGSLGRELFLDCGYPSERVFVTGSARYDHVLAPAAERPPAGIPAKGTCRLLLVAAHHAGLDLEMLDAVCAASEGQPGIELVLRTHPFRRLAEESRFAPYRATVRLAQGDLEAELARADLILFTYSTVAEEAFIRGKPVWQWCSADFNGSALGEVLPIRRFFSVASLREALDEFLKEPWRDLPSDEDRRVAVERLFHRGDGGAAGRIASLLARQARLDEAVVTPACSGR